ncbi:MAG: proteasome accessory factor PafA2 family protein [Patescibacteria group bacterium]|nr:proteasome accessory factor PafA2 family protein [Patescibacteria group bacterium]
MKIKKGVYVKNIFGIENEYNAVLKKGGKFFEVTEECLPMWMIKQSTVYNDNDGTCRSKLTPQNKRQLADAQKKLFFIHSSEVKDIWFGNGGRFYIDMGVIPEYCTPECSSVRELVGYDKAGEKLMYELFKAIATEEGELILRKYNRNTPGNIMDSQIETCTGCHENYGIFIPGITKDSAGDYYENSLLEKYFFNKILNGERYVMESLLSFLVTRQIFAGAGYLSVVGFSSPGSIGGKFLISSRADFIQKTHNNVSTTDSRNIVCTKDKSLTYANCNYRRVHFSVGESNMSEVSNYLKIGTTHLVLRMLNEEENEEFLLRYPKIKNPVVAIKIISADTMFKNKYELAKKYGSFDYLSAIDIQKHFLNAAADFLARHGASKEENRILESWGKVIDSLENDPASLSDTLDYKIKFSLMDNYLKGHNCSWNEIITKEITVRGDKGEIVRRPMIERLMAINVAYHDIGPNGLYNQLIAKNKLKRILSDSEINFKMFNPPARTRARMRGEFIRKIVMDGLIDIKDFYARVGWERLGLPLIGDNRLDQGYCNIPDPIIYNQEKFGKLLEELKKIKESKNNG